MTLLERYRAWRHRRRWPVEMQLDMLRRMLAEDDRWMAHDPKVVALCERYSAVLAEDWMHRSHVSASEFRQRIGCVPPHSDPLHKR